MFPSSNGGGAADFSWAHRTKETHPSLIYLHVISLAPGSTPPPPPPPPAHAGCCRGGPTTTAKTTGTPPSAVRSARSRSPRSGRGSAPSGSGWTARPVAVALPADAAGRLRRTRRPDRGRCVHPGSRSGALGCCWRLAGDALLATTLPGLCWRRGQRRVIPGRSGSAVLTSGRREVRQSAAPQTRTHEATAACGLLSACRVISW